MSFKAIESHPVGIDGQNHILAVTPLKFLPATDFEKRQKSINQPTANNLQNGYFSWLYNWIVSLKSVLGWSSDEQNSERSTEKTE